MALLSIYRSYSEDELVVGASSGVEPVDSRHALVRVARLNGTAA